MQVVCGRYDRACGDGRADEDELAHTRTLPVNLRDDRVQTERVEDRDEVEDPEKAPENEETDRERHFVVAEWHRRVEAVDAYANPKYDDDGSEDEREERRQHVHERETDCAREDRDKLCEDRNRRQLERAVYREDDCPRTRGIQDPEPQRNQQLEREEHANHGR